MDQGWEVLKLAKFRLLNSVGQMSGSRQPMSAAERKQKSREPHPELRKKCDLCGNTSNPHLHSIKSLSESNFALLHQVLGILSLSHSHQVCCDHFESHQQRNFKSSRLHVHKDFATLFYTRPAKRWKINRGFVITDVEPEPEVEVETPPETYTIWPFGITARKNT